MSIIEHDFGLEQRQVVRRFTKLLGLDALHEANVRTNPVPYLERASEHIDRSLQLIHSFGVKAGLVLNPATPLQCLDHVIDRLDLILLMSVNPGFGGQSFIESTLPKIEAVRRRIDSSGRDIWLEVDGGVKADNAERIGSAGADTLVAGSAIFNGGRYQQAIHAIRLQASAGRHARVTLQ